MLSSADGVQQCTAWCVESRLSDVYKTSALHQQHALAAQRSPFERCSIDVCDNSCSTKARSVPSRLLYMMDSVALSPGNCQSASAITGHLGPERAVQYSVSPSKNGPDSRIVKSVHWKYRE